jgi:hypothetical protein
MANINKTSDKYGFVDGRILVVAASGTSIIRFECLKLNADTTERPSAWPALLFAAGCRADHARHQKVLLWPRRALIHVSHISQFPFQLMCVVSTI